MRNTVTKWIFTTRKNVTAGCNKRCNKWVKTINYNNRTDKFIFFSERHDTGRQGNGTAWPPRCRYAPLGGGYGRGARPPSVVVTDSLRYAPTEQPPLHDPPDVIVVALTLRCAPTQTTIDFFRCFCYNILYLNGRCLYEVFCRL